MNQRDLNTIMGHNLKRLRIQANLTQEKLAEKLSISQGLIPRWESGKKGIGKELLIKLCDTFKVQPYEFLIESNTPIPITALEQEGIRIIREAEKLNVKHIAEEAIEFTRHRLQIVKKQKGKSINESKSIRHKSHSK